MDAFFAAVEVLDDPSLRGKPVIVGGSGGRGVVASCTYEARAFGVHSAMPSVRARQLCPAAIFVPGRYSRYAEKSAELREVLERFTPLVEPIGLDEAFLDVRGARRLLGPAEQIAQDIRAAVTETLHLDCSVGVGRTKMVAKLASRSAKPRADRRGTRPGPGVVVVQPADEEAFLAPLPVEALWGVGPATAHRLHELGLRTVGQLAEVPDSVLVRRLGRAHGRHLLALAHGQDDDPVVPHRPAKSVGHEETFSTDHRDRGVLGRHVGRMAASVADHLRSQGLAARTISVKVKFADFSLLTRSHTMPTPIDTAHALAAVAGALLDTVDPAPGVRLVGVSASGLGPTPESQQLSLALDEEEAAGVEPAGATTTTEAARLQASWHEVDVAVDAIRSRFGTAAVGTASMVGEEGIVVPRRREAPWGPGDPPDPAG
jgi:DNA polymerase-4